MTTTDPFESLREPRVPIVPRPAFAEELRRRVAAELGHPRKETQMPEVREVELLEVREYTPARLHSVTPYLACRDAERAIEWYQDVFGARAVGEPVVMDDGSIGHAELRIGDTVFMLAGEFPEELHFGPDTLGGSTVALMVHVPDADATYARAVEQGATALRPVQLAYGARRGVVRDPFGHRWMIATHVEVDDVPVEDAPGRRFGDIGYVTLNVRDADRARRFYSSLFGWQTDGAGDNYHVTTITPPSGIHGGVDEPNARVFFRVDDIETVAARVRELGGEVLSVTEYDSGGNAECVDDQGFRFDLFRPRPGY